MNKFFKNYFIVYVVMQLSLIVLKLISVIDWSWKTIFLVPFLVFGFLGGVIFVLFLTVYLFKLWGY